MYRRGAVRLQQWLLLMQQRGAAEQITPTGLAGSNVARVFTGSSLQNAGSTVGNWQRLMTSTAGSSKYQVGVVAKRAVKLCTALRPDRALPINAQAAIFRPGMSSIKRAFSSNAPKSE